MDFDFSDHSDEWAEAFKSRKLKVPEKCGLLAEGYAKKLCDPTGHLRNSLTHIVVPSELAVYIGTNVTYGKYVELGTGKYAEGGSRPTPWVYQDAKGHWHYTAGQRAHPYLKPVAADHAGEYHDIVDSTLRG